MKILFIHPNMPGQYKHLAPRMAADPDNTVVFITKPRPQVDIPGVHKVEYREPREPSRATHRYIMGFERAILQGQEVWRMCRKLRDDEGFVPDVIVTHPGWGDGLFLKDIYPEARILSFFEFYYRATGADVHFDPGEPAALDDLARVRIKNATNLINLESCDWGISPTQWQQHLHPSDFHHRISVLHDGVDTDAARPNPNATVILKGGLKLTAKDKVVTYIARNFEPYRGFPTFMKAAEKLLKERKDCHIIAVGADGVSYGRTPQGETYRQQWMKRVSLDMDRIHFVGTLPYDGLMKVLQISSAHLYFTYPFVLSWSVMEAMACECLVIGSRTPPVQEVITHGVNGLLCDFFSEDELVQRINEALDAKDRMADIRRAARRHIVDHYALDKLLPLHADLITDLAKGLLPPPTAQRIAQLPTNRQNLIHPLETKAA